MWRKLDGRRSPRGRHDQLILSYDLLGELFVLGLEAQVGALELHDEDERDRDYDGRLNVERQSEVLGLEGARVRRGHGALLHDVGAAGVDRLGDGRAALDHRDAEYLTGDEQEARRRLLGYRIHALHTHLHAHGQQRQAEEADERKGEHDGRVRPRLVVVELRESEEYVGQCAHGEAHLGSLLEALRGVDEEAGEHGADNAREDHDAAEVAGVVVRVASHAHNLFDECGERVEGAEAEAEAQEEQHERLRREHGHKVARIRAQALTERLAAAAAASL